MDAYDRLPKVELHLHLEGAIPLPALWELLCKCGGDPEVPTLEALRRRFTYRDFDHFIQLWIWKNRFLREYDDFTFFAEAVARDLARQHVRYAEAFFSPSGFPGTGLRTGPLLAAVRAGLDRVPAVRVNLVIDLVRNFGPEREASTLEEAAEAREFGVLGFGLGGSELQYPPEPFGPLFSRARELGFHTTCHAGEAAGTHSIWAALNSLRAERLGHATRAIDDPALVQTLGERRIPLELCPLSNLRTGVIADLASHPVRTYFDAGLLVTVNTDDPAMFGNSLAQEFRQLVAVHGFTRDELRTLTLNAVESSWLEPAARDELRAGLLADPGWH